MSLKLDENVLNRVYYDETSPTCLRWAFDVYYGKYKNILMYEKDSVCGFLSSNGYYVVGINRKRYLAHRIVAELHGLVCFGKCVDHINRDRKDNKISNLRVISKEENAKNSTRSKANKSGHRGVRFHSIVRASGKVDNYWHAYYRNEEGRAIGRLFNIDKLGKEEALQQAILWRKQSLEKVNALLILQEKIAYHID